MGGEQPLLVALTGWGQDEDRRRSREAGFDPHLVKPVDAAAFEELLAGSGGVGNRATRGGTPSFAGPDPINYADEDETPADR